MIFLTECLDSLIEINVPFLQGLADGKKLGWETPMCLRLLKQSFVHDCISKESGGFLHEVMMRILLFFIGRIITKRKSGQKDFCLCWG